MTIVKNQHQAEEITQNTFYKAMTAKKAYAGKSSEQTWLCSIARNLAMDECRKNTKFTELDEEQLEQPDNMVESLENKDTALQIHLILHELDEPYKEVFQLVAVLRCPAAGTMQIAGACRIHKDEPWHIAAILFTIFTDSLGAVNKCFKAQVRKPQQSCPLEGLRVLMQYQGLMSL